MLGAVRVASGQGIRAGRYLLTVALRGPLQLGAAAPAVPSPLYEWS